MRLGTIKLNGYDDNSDEKTVQEIFTHDSYETVQHTYDMALLKIDGKIALTDYIRPVCLPKPWEAFYSSDECYTTGWGRVSKFLDSKSNSDSNPTLLPPPSAEVM